eukprot:5679968-Pleurochrysis_carterae.AAC.1
MDFTVAEVYKSPSFVVDFDVFERHLGALAHADHERALPRARGASTSVHEEKQALPQRRVRERQSLIGAYEFGARIQVALLA